MQTQLTALLEQARAELLTLKARPEFEAAKARYVGPNGALTACMKQMGGLPKEQKPIVGKLINEVKTALAAELDATLARIEAAELDAQLGPPIDPTLPSPDDHEGLRHPLTQTRDLIAATFRKLGFVIAEGPELESEWFCFDALNTPDDHPARDMQDTLYFPPATRATETTKKADEAYVLRPHTSSVQIRTMLARKPPIRIVAPGRCFRRDTVDATHSANFHQIEGLWVDRNVTVRDLKSVLDSFVREIFGATAQTRLRPSFFPFTEPSFEMDIKAPNLGRLSDRWLEIMGCGLVDPKVFKNVDIDPEQWTGLAFGMGIERIAMLIHGIDDIRHFYANDLRFLRQFA
ncbi:phenylalanine--tRNA ligase subunit alpha [Termitidicoccus mucosus]|uniref:Phenylalanine--tRNA ligase alpha subunit n=1 Tax=Termitidicoccus mucosus TaxID=1184151 RepID=A0A178IEI4_9BACT|nr:phenylalanine--tRNA ligase subunit alpha [Opitutaceae bacterium TSB47]